MTALLLAGSTVAASLGATTTYYRAAATGYVGDVNSTTESAVQTTCRTPGTYSQIQLVVNTNSRATSTLTFRKNGVAGNQSVSIGSSATGAFTDVTNTDTVVAGDKIDLALTTGSSGTSFIQDVSSVLFDTGDANAVTRLLMLGTSAAAITAAAVTYYTSVAGYYGAPPNTTESTEQWLVRLAGTMRNLGVNVATNTSTSTTAVHSRKNTAAGNLSVSIGASTTGWFEDTTHTDSVVSGDLVAYQIVSSSGTANIVLSSIGVELVGPAGQYHLLSAGVPASGSLGLSLTAYFALGGGLSGASNCYSTTESAVTQTIRAAVNLSNLECDVASNSITATSTMRLRKNTANANQSVSIGASTTGRFEDTTHVDAAVATDTLDYQLVTGSSGTSLLLRNVGVMVIIDPFPVGHAPWYRRAPSSMRTLLARCSRWIEDALPRQQRRLACT